MYVSFELNKGAYLDLRYFLEHDKDVTADEFNDFGDYCRLYLHDKALCKLFYEKSIKLEPKDSVHYFYYARCLTYFGDYHNAIQLSLTYQKVNKVSSTYLFMLSLLYWYTK